MTTTFEDLLSATVGTKKQLGIIENITTGEITDREGNILPKLKLSVKTDTNLFDVDEAWVQTREGDIKPQGLWIKLDTNKQLNAMSTIAKLLEYLNLKTINDLKNKEIQLYPKTNGFLAVIACDSNDFN